MNVILPILLITSLLHSISSQSSTSSFDKKKKKYDDTDKYVADVDTSDDDSKRVLESPPSNVTQAHKGSVIPLDLNKIGLYHRHLQQYKKRVPEELKEEMQRHNTVNTHFTFSPYLSMAAALHRIESRQFAKFLAMKILDGLEDANEIWRDVPVHGHVRMKHIRATSYQVKDYYEKPRGSRFQGTHFPNHNLTFGTSLRDLGMKEYDAQGHLVKDVGPRASFSLENIGIFHKYLQDYEGSVSEQLKKELHKYRLKGKFHELSPYLSMAAAFYGISNRVFVKFLTDNIAHKNITNVDQIGNDELVAKDVWMMHLRDAARKIKKHFDEEVGAGPSSSGSRSEV